MRRTPAISIVMPLYNKAAEVSSSVASVRAQTVQDWELIVVDDGSTDGGAQLVHSLQDPRIRVEHQANAGVSAARNRGIALASSDWVSFLDADDLWHPEFLQRALALRHDFPAAEWCATAYEVRSKGGSTYTCRLRGLPEGFHRGLLRDYFALAARSDPPVWTSAVIVRVSALQGIGGFPVGIGSGEDLLTWALLAVRYVLAYDTSPSAVFVVSGIERAPDPMNRVGQALEDLARSAQHHHGLRSYLALWYRMQATMALRFDQPRRARSLLWRSIQLRPSEWRSIYAFGLSLLPARGRIWLDRRARRLAGQRN